MNSSAAACRRPPSVDGGVSRWICCDAETHSLVPSWAPRSSNRRTASTSWRFSHMKTVERIIGNKMGTRRHVGRELSEESAGADLLSSPRYGNTGGCTVAYPGARSCRASWRRRGQTQILGDPPGADVIKIEKPGEGDETRPVRTAVPDGARTATRGDATYFLTANRNKKSVTVDLSEAAGCQALVKRLARRAHVVVENFKTGALAKYGLDYEMLRAENPALIYCSLTGFGHTGPYKDKAGYDYVVQGMAGLMSITGQKGGEPGAEPMKVGVAVSDLITGLNTAIAILAAVIHQARTGEGQAIDMALFDCQVAALANQATGYLSADSVPGRLGNAHPSIVPYQVFATGRRPSDPCNLQRQPVPALRWSTGVEAFAADPRFATNAERVAHRDPLVDMLKPVFAKRTTAQWIADLEAANVPCGPINRIDQVFSDPQAIARNLTVAMTACRRRPDDAGRQPSAALGDATRIPQRAAACWANTRTKSCRASSACRPARSPGLRRVRHRLSDRVIGLIHATIAKPSARALNPCHSERLRRCTTSANIRWCSGGGPVHAATMPGRCAARNCLTAIPDTTRQRPTGRLRLPGNPAAMAVAAAGQPVAGAAHRRDHRGQAGRGAGQRRTVPLPPRKRAFGQYAAARRGRWRRHRAEADAGSFHPSGDWRMGTAAATQRNRN